MGKRHRRIRARSATGQVAGAANEKPGLEAHRPIKRPAQPAFSQKAPRPSRPNLSRPPDVSQPSETSFMPRKPLVRSPLTPCMDTSTPLGRDLASSRLRKRSCSSGQCVRRLTTVKEPAPEILRKGGRPHRRRASQRFSGCFRLCNCVRRPSFRRRTCGALAWQWFASGRSVGSGALLQTRCVGRRRRRRTLDGRRPRNVVLQRQSASAL